MHYDVATKILMDHCRNEILRRFIGIDVKESTYIETLPQETVSVRRSDYPMMVTDQSGIKTLVLVYIQTRWELDIAMRMLEYRYRHIRTYKMKAVSCLILLRPFESATDLFEDHQVRFTYHLIKLYELHGNDMLSSGPVCLLPFVPIMKEGEKAVDEADRLIYNSDLSRGRKADMLICMTILAGMVSGEMSERLLARRRDIMIESVAYDLIRNEGRKEGTLEGLLKGLYSLLKLKFHFNGINLYEKVKTVQDLETLEKIFEASVTEESLESLTETVRQIVPSLDL